MEQPKISHVEIGFTQDGNTLGTTTEVESLTLCLEFQQYEEDGPFYVIKTEGWSFDNLEEIKKLVDRAEKLIKKY